jgi:hypothetical protein
MLITEALPSKRVSIQVDWVRPFVTCNVNEFVLEGDRTSTRVTWTTNGPNQRLAVTKTPFLVFFRKPHRMRFRFSFRPKIVS